MLGLQDYGSDGDSPAQTGGVAPAASAAAPVAAGSSGPRLLSVVDYGMDEDDAEREARVKGAASVGVALDEDELDRASTTSRVGGVGVQVSVVKRAAGGASGAAASGSDSPPAPPAHQQVAATSGPAAFVVPDSPPCELNPRTMEKYLGYVKAANEGNTINDHIRHSKKFRNPCLLDKLVAFLGVQEFGTNYPAELYDPSVFGAEQHYDALEEKRREWEAKQSRKQGERVDFRSGGATQPAEGSGRPAGVSTAPPPAAAIAAAAAAAAAAVGVPAAGAEGAPAKRKSKWDNGGDKKPRAQ